MAADKIIGSGQERVHAGAVPVMRAWTESGDLEKLDLPTPDLRLRLVWRDDREDLSGLRDVRYAASA